MVKTETGSYYLGNITSSKNKKFDTPFLYESKDLTTHAVILGMTGSGKTGLGIDLLEESSLDHIPALIIDPKGDMGNLLLTFPDMKPEDFIPWIDSSEADRKKTSIVDIARQTATDWKDGIEASGQSLNRVRLLQNSVTRTIYTPASKAGIPLSILSSFKAPSKEILENPDEFRDRVITTVSSLLGLLGIDADPIKNKEHILLSTIIETCWKEGKDLSLESLIQQVQNPLFVRVGVFDLETFFPEKERLSFSITLNNLLASPAFRSWNEGEPLEIQALLYTDQGKPKQSILSIAHLQNPERMFFVTLFLNELISWMRRQTGTSTLRVILYMDEIFGFFPPNGMPPSKKPMLTLLKQARAYGLGIVLSTQNPVDLDYKGLSNCGTWFIGKLQTEQDIGRILNGLKNASLDDSSSIEVQSMLSQTGKRKFVMKNVHKLEPVLFETRFSLSYLKGPLSLPQISTLMTKQKVAPIAQSEKPEANTSPESPVGIEKYFLEGISTHHYRPYFIGFFKLHFVDAKNKIDYWKKLTLVTPAHGNELNFDQKETLNELEENQLSKMQPNGTFQELPTAFSLPRNFINYKKDFADYLYQNETLNLFFSTDAKMLANLDETETDFRIRISQTLREKRDNETEKIRKNYQLKIQTLQERIKRSEIKYEKEKSNSFFKKIEAFFSFLATLLSSLVSRNKISSSTISKAGTTLRKLSHATENQSVTQAESSLTTYQQQLENLQIEMQQEMDRNLSYLDPSKISIETITIRPRKSDIDVDKVGILWKSD